ncbi:hypothetical protein GCM10011384_27900 [Psychrobacillus lasiicapitis]|nr:hypothetical protein GCM10011384_27900 [Psychrobacillus lasiicapitis]
MRLRDMAKEIDFHSRRTLTAGRAVSLLVARSCGVSPVAQYELKAPQERELRGDGSRARGKRPPYSGNPSGYFIHLATAQFPYTSFDLEK